MEFVAMLLEPAAKIVAAVQAHVAEHPDVPVERARLRRTLRRGARAEKRKAKSDPRFRCNVSAIGTAKRQRFLHTLEQKSIWRSSVQRNNALESAHLGSNVTEENDSTNRDKFLCPSHRPFTAMLPRSTH